MESDSKTVHEGKNIKRIREILGIKQDALAIELGLSQQAISQLEQKETLDGVRDGSIVGTVVQQPFEFGYQSVKLMEKILTGDKSVIPPNKQIIVPTLMIKKDSVDEFEKKLNQLRGRT